MSRKEVLVAFWMMLRSRARAKVVVWGGCQKSASFLDGPYSLPSFEGFTNFDQTLTTACYDFLYFPLKFE